MSRKLIVQRIAIVAVVAVLLLAAGCGSAGQVKVDDKSNGKQIDVQRNHTLAVTLESNPSTGYRWEVVEVDKAILEQMGDATFKYSGKTPIALGTGGWETFMFKAAKAGQTTLKMVYRRSWETVAPLTTYTLQVVVR